MSDNKTDTQDLLSWSSQKFVRAPSSLILMWTVIAICFSLVIVMVLTNYIQMDVTIKATGEVLSDFGTRTAIAPATGQISGLKKKVGDLVHENEIIATLMLDEKTEKEILTTIDQLKNTEKNIHTFQSESKVFDFNVVPVKALRLSTSPALDALFTLEQQGKSFTDLKARFKTALDIELRPLRQRASFLSNRIKQMKSSSQKQLMEMYVESTEEELGKVRMQIAGSENDTRLKLEQSLSDYLRNLQNTVAALENYLSQRQVKAPISGVLARYLVKENSSVEIAKPIAVIMPENGKHVAATRVYSKDIIKIAANQKTLFQVEAYPHQTYGLFPGKVISFEPLNDNVLEGKENIGSGSGGDYVVYSTIDFPKDLKPELKDKMKLVLGMKFNSEIIVDRKTINALIYESIFKKK